MIVSEEHKRLVRDYQCGSYGNPNSNDKVINVFLNFLSNPSNSNNNIKVLYYNGIDPVEIIKNILMLIDLSCESSINRKDTNFFNLELYRCEHQNNLAGYRCGKLTSFKSTSKFFDETRVFDGKDKRYIIFENERLYFPYICVNDFVNSTNIYEVGLQDEREYILPPFIKCTMEDDTREKRGYKCLVVHIDDKFEPLASEKIELATQKYEAIKDAFSILFRKWVLSGLLSDELKQYCKIIYEYLECYARSKYYKCNLDYNFRNGFPSLCNVYEKYNDYSGFLYALQINHGDEERIKKDKTRINSNVPHVYALGYLFEWDSKKLEQIYQTIFSNINRGRSFNLDDYLKNILSVNGKLLSNDELAKALQLFNVAAGVRDDGTMAYMRERMAAANELCLKRYSMSKEK